MSKLQLKKELLNMDQNQLVQLILDAYSARKETKEYFDFFLNPDVEKLLTKYEIAVSKELSRVKRGGYCKARISFIKKLLKEFASYQPGFQAEMDLLSYTIKYAMMSEQHLYFPDTLKSGIASIVKRLVEIADVNMQVDSTINELKTLLDTPKAGSRHFRMYLNNELASILGSVRIM